MDSQKNGVLTKGLQTVCNNILALMTVEDLPAIDISQLIL